MKNLKFILGLALLISFTSACTDELDLNPAQSLSTEEALSDISGMRTALNGAYDVLQSVDYYGREYLVMPETEANLVYLSIANSNRFVDSYGYSWTLANGDINAFWNRAYQAILRANNIINNIANVEGEAAEKNQIEGEALAIRAIAHFDLVRFFAKPYTTGTPSSDLGVPILTEAKIDEPARNSVEAVYNQVIADLTAAEGKVGSVSDVGIYNFNEEAISALLARVYLYKGDMGLAASAASKVISNTTFSLADDVAAMFAAPGSSEEIFTLKNEVSEDRGSDNLGNIYNPDGYGDIRVSQDLIDLYTDPNDQRLGFIYMHTDGENYQSKYLKASAPTGLHSPKLLRLSEMYLIRAEATYMTDATAALGDLNAIRMKRGAADLTSVDLATIIAERQRELAFEGHTAFDLYRNGLDMVRTECNTGIQLNVTNCTISASSHLTVHPIPENEMNVNQNMVQNEGY